MKAYNSKRSIKWISTNFKNVDMEIKKSSFSSTINIKHMVTA